MSHSLRRVCSVIGRAHLRQVAYTAMEAAGQTYRRQCHVFQTDDIHQVSGTVVRFIFINWKLTSE
ncbi:unnamed protein product [Strongylus vulgaris]|uniref:PID domain-containing protein n=1 Tax=Strongylus vulgaris TaxID=40348 RepID=A0A3P7J8M6_STRVU|nr:unnamed protein product [Strongylus vulgaris]